MRHGQCSIKDLGNVQPKARPEAGKAHFATCMLAATLQAAGTSHSPPFIRQQLLTANIQQSSSNSCSDHTAPQPRLLTQPGITCYFAKPHMSVPVGLPGSTATSILGCRLTPSLMPVNSRSHMPLAHPNQHRLVHDKTAMLTQRLLRQKPLLPHHPLPVHQAWVPGLS